MEISDHIKIMKITPQEILKPRGRYYSIIFIVGTIDGLLIDDVLHKDITNTMFFLNPEYQWKIFKGCNQFSKGYILCLSDTIMNEPFLKGLPINEMRILHPDKIYSSPVAAGLEKRLKALIDMLDEFMASTMDHREDAVLSLLNTFFIYCCDEMCIGKEMGSANNRKAVLVYKFMTLMSSNITEITKVGQYAEELNVSSAYLNECIYNVMGISAKSLIIEHLAMRSRRTLKSTDKSVKEIAYELGFSSPDYFSSFCKKHTGYSPSEIRKA